MTAISVILIVGGFILGIFGGLTMSRPDVLLNDKRELKKEKQFSLSIITGVSALAMVVGFLLYFKGFSLL